MSSAHPTPLETPVTVQGATHVEGTDRRELFTETAKTTLVFENGAVVNLKTKVVQGQAVFLRNERSGREILCKVVEWRKGGVGGYVDLEFTSRDPHFWEVTDEQVAAEAQQKSAQAATAAQIIARAQAELAASRPSPAPEASPAESRETAAGALPAASAEIPAETPALAATEPRAATAEPPNESAKEPVKISPEKLELAPASEPAPQPELNDEQAAQMLATMMAGDTKSKPKRESAADAAEAAQHRLPPEAEGAALAAGTTSEATGNGKGISRLAAWSFQLREFGPEKKTIALGIAAIVLIVAAVGFGWRAMRKSSVQASNRAVAAAAPSAAHAPAADSPKSPTSPAPSANVLKVAATTDKAAAPAKPESKADVANDIRTAAALAAKRNHESDLRVLGELPSGNARGKAADGGNAPAKILSQAAPAIPKWAKKLDLNPVVQLDAVIDANGNLKSTRPISGPRILQGEAQRAVALWVFQPAMVDGKPATAHLVLTVEFQR